MQVHNKKVRKAYAKFNPELAQRLRGLTPTYKLDHLVRERWVVALGSAPGSV